MVAITQRDSALHRTVGELRPAGSLREQRAAELCAVLGGVGLGALLPKLEREKIGSLAMLQWKLARAELSVSAAQRRQLCALGLCEPAAPRAPTGPARMERM